MLREELAASVAVPHGELLMFSVHGRALMNWYRVSHVVQHHDCNKNDAVSSSGEIYSPNVLLHAFQPDYHLNFFGWEI